MKLRMPHVKSVYKNRELIYKVHEIGGTLWLELGRFTH